MFFDVVEHDSSNDRYQKSFIVWSSVVCLGIYTLDFQVHANKKSYKHLILNDSIVSKTYCVHTEKINSIFPKNSQILKFDHYKTGDKSDGVIFSVTKDFVTRKW